MERLIYNDLLEWKQRKDRKPLILLGARQVGKTYIVKEFGRREFENIVYVDCHQDNIRRELFRDLHPERIIYDIEHQYGQKVSPGRTLLFFDEIQEAPNGISSLKYFCEEMRELHVVAAGSLLGISLRENESYPVGKVNMLKMYPMGFDEFLCAMNRKPLSKVLKEEQWDSMERLNETFVTLLRQYYFCGGMPEAVRCFAETHDTDQVRLIQRDILDNYYRDMAKHASLQAERVRLVWQSIVSQLARENKKFIYGAVRSGARAATFEEAIQWLVDAGLVYRVERTTLPQRPLKFYVDHNAFKLYMLDCGLLACMAEATPAEMLLGNRAFVEFKGAFTENFVLQQMRACSMENIYYYSKEKSTMEVDFLCQTDTRVLPVEVKAEENVKSKSLTTFIHYEFADIDLKATRFSMKPYVDQGWMENVPLYAAEAYLRNAIEHDRQLAYNIS